MNRRHSSALLSVALLVGSSFAPPAPAQAPAAQAPAAPAVAPPAIYAKFDKSLNSKKTKVGDPVTARTVTDLRLKEFDIPKGSHLVGTVAAVQSEKDGNGTASLAIKFDHIELKSGSILRVQGLIVSIAEVTNDTGLGPTSVLGRGGQGSTPGLDPNVGLGKIQDDIPPGSTIPGVALGTHLTPEGASELRGIHTEIKLDSDTEIKVALFRGN